MKDKWLKDLHDKMADYEEEAPDMLWESIESKLIQNARAKKERNGFRIWKILAAAAILLLLVAVSVTYFINDDDLNLQDKSSGLANSSVVNEAEFSLNKEEEPSDIKNNKAKKQPFIATHNTYHPVATAIKPVISKAATDTGSETPSSPSTEIPQQENSATNKTTPLTPHKYSERHRDNIAENASLNTSRANTPQKRFSFAIFASGMPEHSSSSITTTPFAASLGADNANWADSPELGIMLFNKGKHTRRNVHHNLPFRAGITFAYRISKNLSIESGLSYSLLTSDFSEGSDKNLISTRQSLHYLGIPINVRYNFLSWNRLDFYGSAGVIAEQCISAKQNTDYVLDNRIEISETENIDEKPLQFSADISAGIQFNFSSLIGIYIEPGAVYHFKNRSELQTIYKDRPFDFNLNIGLRFTFGN